MTRLSKTHGRGSWRTETVMIPNGQSETSGVIDARGYRLAKIYPPADLTDCKIAVLDSPDGTAFGQLYDFSGQPVALSVTAGKPMGIPLGTTALAGLGIIRLKSVSTSDGTTAVNQAASRNFTVVLVE